MVQQILIGILFLAAAAYLGVLLFGQFRAKTGCSAGCGKCGSLDIDQIEARIKADSN